MTGGNGNGNGSDTETQEVLAKLMESGFFQQFLSLEQNLQTIAGDLKSLGTAATQRIQETESLAVHVLAVESILLTLLQKYPLATEDVLAVARRATGAPDSDEGNPAVLNVIEDLMAKLD